MHTIENYIDAEKHHSEAHGECGFSLVELIVVVAILGVIVAVAIPLVAGLQATATESAARADAANAAMTVAAQIANEDAVVLPAANGDWMLALKTANPTLKTLCVQVTLNDASEVLGGFGSGC